MQPVDILGYTDAELLDLIEKINELEPYAFSIVDTFGSLYREDLQRVFYLVHHNLWANAKIDSTHIITCRCPLLYLRILSI